MATTARVSTITRDPAAVKVGEVVSLHVEVVRELGGPKEQVSVAVKCRDAAFTIEPSEMAVDLPKNAKTGAATDDFTITGDLGGEPFVDLLVEGKLGATKSCNVRLKK